MSFLLKKVQENLINTLQMPENKHFLLAVSGGVDSMVLLDVFTHLKLSFHLAHVNFQLRDVESEQDEHFVYAQSKQYISEDKIHIQRFNTLHVLEKTSDTSIQMLARKLRYEWFYTLLAKYQLDYIVTAHHADDNIETFFLKLFRKSTQGLSGMDMLSEKKILRPFLNVFKHEIQEYAHQNNILYREDSSNLKDDYLRNHIRHHLIPFIEQHYPEAKTSILSTMHYQKEIHSIAKTYIDEIWQKSTTKYWDCYIIDLTTLYQYPKSIQTFLPWHFAERLSISMKQFTQFKHLFEPDTKTGKQMQTKTYKAVRYKTTIEIFPVNTDKNTVYQIKPKILQEQILIYSDRSIKNEVKDILLRRWQHGDKIFHNNKPSLIADLIPEYNITPYQKEYLYVGIEKNEIKFVCFCPNSVFLQFK